MALAVIALAWGAISGLLEAAGLQDLGLSDAFIIYVGLLGFVATTWAASMGALPLGLVPDEVTACIRFALAYHGLCHVVSKLGRGRVPRMMRTDDPDLP